MTCTRREVLTAGAATLAGRFAWGDTPASAPTQPMGIVIHSYGIRKAADRQHAFDDPLTFLDYCRGLGAGGAQTGLGVRDDAYAESLRAFAEKHALALEGSIALPRDEADVRRFTAEVKTAKRSGVTVFRTVLMSGRRYEVFDSAEAFRQFHEQGRQALFRARPVVERFEIRMAVENHKDLLAPDLLTMIEALDCPWIGVCIDTGNNLALLEASQATVDLLAARAFTTHIKDMGVEEYADGFLLAEVPLGAGILDLPRIIATIRRAQPQIRLNLEMITRNPLKIPCLTPRYWTTLDVVPARRLAETLALVRAKAAKPPLPCISALSPEEQLRREDDHVRQSLRYAHETLGA